MLLSGENLAVARDGRLIFSGIDLAVKAGELLLISGPNGSGKTSLLKAIAGLLPLAAGRLRLEGGREDLTISQQSHLIGHSEAVKPQLTVWENQEFWCGFLGGRDEKAGLEAFGLSELAELPAAVLSAGQRRRLALSRLAAAHRPLWLLDEPNTGLDTQSLSWMRLYMRKHLASGGLIIAAAHGDLEIASTHRIELEKAA
jgi:heme exporter protein A